MELVLKGGKKNDEKSIYLQWMMMMMMMADDGEWKKMEGKEDVDFVRFMVSKKIKWNLHPERMWT